MSKIVKTVGVLAVSAVALYGGMMKVVLPYYVSTLVPTVETTAAQYINGKVHIGQISLSPGLTVTAGDISVVNDRGEEIAQVPSIDVGINPLKGLWDKSGVGAVSSIRINNPVVTMTMNKQDKWNISGLIKPSEEKSTAFKGEIYVNNGHLLINTPYGRWESGVQGTIDAGNNPDYTLDANLFLDNERMAVSGHINTDLQGRLNLKTDSMKLDNFAVLIAHYIPVHSLSGSLENVDVSWESKEQVSMSGGGMLNNVMGNITGDGYDVPLVLKGEINFNGMALQTSKLQAMVNQETCVISGGLNLEDSSNPQAEELNVEFQKFDLQKAQASLPVDGVVSGKVVVNGTKEDYSVNGTLKAPSLSVHGYTFKNVTLPIITNQGKLMAQNATGEFGGGKLNVSAEYGLHSKDLAAAIDASKVDLAPLTDSDLGEMRVNGSLLLSGNVGSNRLKLSSVGDFMTLTWKNTQFHTLGMDVDVDGSNVTVNNFTAYTPDQGMILAQGSMAHNVVDGKVTAVRMPLENFLSLAGQTGSGLLSGEFTVKGNTASPNVSGPFSLEQSRMDGVKIAEAHGFARWENRILSLTKAEVNMEQGSHEVDGTVNMQTADPILDLTVKTDNVRIEPLWQFLHMSFPVTGNLSNQVTVTGPLSNPTVNGQVKAWDGSVNKFLVDGVSGTYSYRNGTLALKNFQVRTLTTAINLEGTIDPKGKLDFGLDAMNIHLARIPGLNNYADVEGMVDFNGSLAGTMQEPLFNGAVTSNHVVVNGEAFTGIACYLHSKGGTVNALDGTFQQEAGGDYAVKLLSDFKQHLVQGDIDIQKVNVKSLANIAKEDLDIGGFLTGKIEINKAGINTGMTVVGSVDKAAVRGIEFKTAEFDLFARRGYWRINNFKAEEKSGGLLLAKGEVDARPDKRTVDMEIGTSGASAKLLTVAMTHPLDLEGKMDVAAQIKGSLDNPQGNFSLQVSPGSISKVNFDNLYAMVTLRDDMFKLEQVLLQRGEYKISAYGNFPQDLLRKKEDRRNLRAKMDLLLNLDNANLAILPSVSPVVETADGDINGGLTITGTMEDYNINGNIQILNGNVKFKRVTTTLDNIKLDADFGGKQVNLKNLSATTGKNGKGKIEAHGTFALAGETRHPYLLDFSTKDVRIESQMFKGTINAQGNIQQKRNRPHLTTNIRLDDVLLDVISVPELGQGKTNMGIDVTLELGPKIHMHNSYFYNMWLAGAVHATGSVTYPHVEGRVYATKGTISYLSTPFDVLHAELNWPQRGFIPHVNFEANTRFRNYNVKVKANGPLNMDTLSMVLTSDPPKSQRDIIRMLTLKTDSTNTDDDMQSLLDAGLQMAFLSDVEDYVKRALTLDEFRVYSGNTRSSLGFDLDSLRANSATGEEKKQYNLLFSKKLAKDLRVGYTTSFDQEYHSVFAEYNLGRHFSLNFSQNEKSEKWYGIQYQTSF